MRPPTDEELASALATAMSDAFNRSISALEAAGAIDVRQMRAAYAGMGSKYYDLVTEQIEHTARNAVSGIRQLFPKPESDGAR